MKNWWNWVLVLGLISLLFIAVPLMYPTSTRMENMREMFDNYLNQFNKTYRNNTPEYETRLQHFINSINEIDELNAASRGPEPHRARYGLTYYSDMSKDEFREVHLSSTRNHNHRHRLSGDTFIYNVVVNVDNSRNRDDHVIKPAHLDNAVRRKRAASLPIHMDWREKGYVSPVRDQGLCGACWAFSTIGTMETMAAIATGKLNTLSVQEVIDCAGLGNSGCLGGDICLLLDWLALTNTPVQLEKEYPLKLTDGVCTMKKNATGVRVKKYTCGSMVGAEEKILESIAIHGPVAVAVNALTWQNYLGGIIQYHCSGLPADLNHAVELVGYDLTHDVPYYIAKNSWGSTFGVDGYLQLAIGTNICGLAHEVATVDVTV